MPRLRERELESEVAELALHDPEHARVLRSLLREARGPVAPWLDRALRRVVRSALATSSRRRLRT